MSAWPKPVTLASTARKQVRSGEDPIAARKRVSPRAHTFGQVADALMSELEAGWKHPAHRQQWKLPDAIPRAHPVDARRQGHD